jgi:hypothetical protein
MNYVHAVQKLIPRFVHCVPVSRLNGFMNANHNVINVTW